MRITSAGELDAILARPPVWGYCLGVLPGAPRDTLVWWRPVTVAEAKRAYGTVMLHFRDGYTEEDGKRAVVSSAMMVNPGQLQLGEGDEATLPDPALLERFCEPEDLEPLGDAQFHLDGSASPLGALFAALSDATGFVVPPDEEAGETTLATLRSGLRGYGRWVSGWCRQEPEAEVFVAPLTERHAFVADTGSRATYGVNEPLRLAILLSHVLLDGPRGAPLLTVDQCEALPYGGAQALYQVSYQLAHGGRAAGVSFRTVEDAGQPEPGGAGQPDLADHREATPPAGGAEPAPGGDHGQPAGLGKGRGKAAGRV